MNDIRALLALVICISQMPLHAQTEASVTDRVAALLIDFPRPDEIDYLRRQLTEAKGLTDYGRAKIEKTLALVRERIPLLKPLIRSGISVFTYPGLIAAGTTTFTPGKPGAYLLTLGAHTRAEDINDPPQICITIDDTGIITGVTRPTHL